MGSDTLQVLIPVIVASISAISGYVIAKLNNKKDMTINDRQLLSADEREFRTQLLEEIKQYKQEVVELRKQVGQLTVINVELKLENEQLVIKIEELKNDLALYSSRYNK